MRPPPSFETRPSAAPQDEEKRAETREPRGSLPLQRPCVMRVTRRAPAARPRLLGRRRVAGEEVLDRRPRGGSQAHVRGAQLHDRARRLVQGLRPLGPRVHGDKRRCQNRACAGGRRAWPSSSVPAPRRACRDRRPAFPPVRAHSVRRARQGARPGCGALQLRAGARASATVSVARGAKGVPLPAAVARPAGRWLPACDAGCGRRSGR